MPAFTILMANYNKAPYIQIAIESVLAQTFADWELLIIDDGSDDESLFQARRYTSDSRIRIYLNGQNEGYTKALIRGLTRTSSEIVGILDSDDALVPSAIERVYAEFQENPRLGLVLSQLIYCDSSLHPIYVSSVSVRHAMEPLLWMRGPTAFRSFRMSAYQRTAGLNPNLRGGEDADLLFKLEEVTDVKRINEPLYLYRQLGTSQSKKAYHVTYCDIAKCIFAAYWRRRGTSLPNLPPTIVLGWLLAGVRYSLELNDSAEAFIFLIKAAMVRPLRVSSYRHMLRIARDKLARAPLEHRHRLVWRRVLSVREFQSATGNRHPDRIVCIPGIHSRGHCLFGGDFLIFEKGYYQVRFELSIEADNFAQPRIAVLDIYENLRCQAVIGELCVRSTDVPAGKSAFEVDFVADEGQRVEFRVYWAGTCTLSVTGLTFARLLPVEVPDPDRDAKCDATPPSAP